jgi:hypothetical protein
MVETEEHVIKAIFNLSYPSFDKLQSKDNSFRALVQWFKDLFKNNTGAQGQYKNHIISEKNGWGGRIRTHEWRYQKPLPYRLATPQKSHSLSQYPNWNILQNTTKLGFLGLLILFFLFSSPCQASPNQGQIDNTYQSKVIIRNNRGSSIENLRKFKDGLLYSSQNELFFNLDKINLSTFNNEYFRINNLIVDDQDFYLLTTNGVYKNFSKIFNKEECFHLEKSHERIWISCQSGIYSSKLEKDFNWELDSKSPQAVVYFSLNDSKTKPQYAASSQFGFFKYDRRKWYKRNIGLLTNPNGDYEFGRFLVTKVLDLETIYLPTSYGIAISNNKAKDFFLDAQGIEKENGLITIKDLKQDSQGNLILISSTGAYQSKLELIPKWKKINFDTLRKSENNFVSFCAIDVQAKNIYLSTQEGEIISLEEKITHANNLNTYGNSFYSSNELIERFLNLEPQIAQVHQKALEFAGIPTGETYRTYSKRAKLRNLAPRFETYLERDNEDLLQIQTTGQDDLDGGTFSTSFDRVDQNRNNNSINTGIRFSWDFTKVFYDEEQIDINNNARLTANIRENLLTEITQLYFQRKEALADAIHWLIHNDQIKTHNDLLKQKLRLEESLAQLDARTGSWYSKELNKELFKLNSKNPQTLKTMELYTNVKVN